MGVLVDQMRLAKTTFEAHGECDGRSLQLNAQYVHLLHLS